MAIQKFVAGWDLFDKETMKALGLPENVTKVVITAEVDSVVTVECTYFPPLGEEENAQQLIQRIKTFVLVERSDEEAQ